MSQQEDASEAVELESAPPAPGRALRRLAFAALLLVVVGAIAVVIQQRRPEDPDQTLADITDFVAAGTTVHVEGFQEWTSVDGRDGLGSEMTDRTRLVADVRLPRESRLRIDDGDQLTEMIVMADATYLRYADDEKALAAEEWVRTSRSEADDDAIVDLGGESAGSLLAQGFAVGGGMGMAPLADLHELFEAFEDPVRVSHDVIRVEMPLRRLMEIVAPDFSEGAGEDVDLDGDVSVDLTSGPDGRLDRMRTTVEMEEDGSSSTSTDDLRFTRWGEPVTIAAPGDDEIDHTPSFDEEGLVTAPFAVLAPRSVPEPLRLVEASFAEGDADYDECASVYLRYSDPVAEEEYETAMENVDPASFDDEDGPELPLVRSLDITLSALSCASADEREAEDAGEGAEEPFSAGPHRGTVVRSDDPDYGTTLNIVLDIDGTRIEVSADIPEAEVVAALAALGPLDLAQQPVVQLPTR